MLRMTKLGFRINWEQLRIPKKRPPEKQCPRGAEDTTPFRERLDAPRSSPSFDGPRDRALVYKEALRRHPCLRPSASQSAGLTSSR
jgi:hypothetical protein